MNVAAEQVWEIAPDAVQARVEEVHVWRAVLETSASCVEKLSGMLSEEERSRCARFHFERDRSRFIVRRAYLRILLGRYLQKPPAEITFGYGPNGKPFLAGEKSSGLRFNLSHSQGLALYAVSKGREIGVDLEYKNKNLEIAAMAERFFSNHEIAALKSLPDHERSDAFFACWSRKEAYIKARGEGLSIPLDGFSVSLIPGKPAALLEVRSDPAESSRWSFLELAPDSRYAGALAVEGRDWRPRYWDFDRTRTTHHGDTESAE